MVSILTLHSQRHLGSDMAQEVMIDLIKTLFYPTKCQGSFLSKVTQALASHNGIRVWGSNS
jgi:hypothetical protein